MSATLRWTWPMSTPGSIGSAIERLVDEPVRLGVALAADVADRPALERRQRPRHLAVELAQRRVLDLVFALDLAHDQLRVADQLDLAGAERLRALDPEQQRPVLGDVVGGGPDPLSDLLQHPAVGVLDDDPDRGRAGVAPGA